MTEYPPCSHPYEGWFVDGVPLSQEGFLLAEFIETMPPRRGEDIIVARRPGSRWQQKFYDSRTQTLIVWALKNDEFGNVKGGNERNVDRLKRLFGGGLKQVELTRTITFPFRVSTRKAIVELVDAVSGERTALTQTGVYTSFAVDLKFHDPYWYEPYNTTTFGSDYGPHVIWNPGTVQNFDATARIFGPAVDPEISVEPTGSIVQLELTLGPNEWVDLNSYDFTAINNTGTSVAGTIRRQQINLIEIAPGRNELTLTDGTCDFKWRPTYL